jgi:hypothetical protein
MSGFFSGQFSVLSFQFRRRKRRRTKNNAEGTEDAEIAEIAEKRKTTQEGFLSTRPDAPQNGAEEKIGPLRSE